MNHYKFHFTDFILLTVMSSLKLAAKCHITSFFLTSRSIVLFFPFFIVD